MLRKICACLIIASGVFSQISPIYAYESTIAISASSLSTSQMRQIDMILADFSQDRLQEVQERLKATQEKQSALPEETQALLEYIGQQIEQLLNMVEMEAMLKADISDNDKSLAREEILGMQEQFADSLKETLSGLLLNWEEMTQYEEKGNLDIHMNFDIPSFMKMDGGLSIANYTARTQKFNQDFKGYVDAFFTATVQGEEVDIAFKSLVDYISVDGNIYLLLEQLSLSSKNKDDSLLQEFQPYVEKFQELAKDGSYVSYLDEDAQIALSLLKSYSPDTLPQRIDEVSSKPLLEAYAVDNGSYILRPSKEFCDLGKEITHVFDPFNGKTCSDSQYEKMLEDFQNSGISISLTPGANKLLKISLDKEDVQGDINIAWSSVGIISISADIFDPNKKDVRHITLDFTPRSSFKLDILADEFSGNLHIDFSRKGVITNLVLNANIQDTMNVDTRYSNGKIRSHFSLNEGGQIDCSLDGKLQTDYAKLTGECTLVNDMFGYMIPGEDTMQIDANLLLDTRVEKNNLTFNYDASIGNTEVFHLDITNIGTRKALRNIRIKAPEKTVKYSDIQEEIFNEIYGSDTFYNDYESYGTPDDFDYEGYDYDKDYTDEETGINYFCNEYRYDEQANYDYCEQYITEEEFYTQYDAIEEIDMNEVEEIELP